MTYFCSIGSQILYIFETHGIGQTPSSLERYLVSNILLTVVFSKVAENEFVKEILREAPAVKNDNLINTKRYLANGARQDVS